MDCHNVVIDGSEDEEELLAHVSRSVDEHTISNVVDGVSRRLEERRRRNVVGNRSPSASIFKLPSSLRGVKYKFGQPKMVSIGPYHRGKDHLLEFEEYKWFFLGKFLDRTRSEKNLHDHLREMLWMEAQTRMCYSEDVLMSSEDFVEMMLLDGCFLIEILCQLGRDESDADLDLHDPVFTRPWLIPMIVRDIVLLENQLPLFVLKSLSPKSDRGEEFFIKLILEFFSLSWPDPTLNKLAEFLECSHLLEVFYQALIPSFSVNSIVKQEKYCPSRLQCVTQLRQSGIKIKPRKAESFLDIKYEKQVLQIPSITMNEITSTVLINCVALEQCQDRNIKYFSNYVSFMYCLIGQPTDVALLVFDGVISNFSQDDQYVADLFQDLGKNTVLNVRGSYLWKVVRDVDAYYNSHWAYMMRTYFSSPWSCISVISAFVLLILTMVQSVMSVLSYFHELK